LMVRWLRTSEEASCVHVLVPQELKQRAMVSVGS
jgi:hypothetical protein